MTAIQWNYDMGAALKGGHWYLVKPKSGGPAVATYWNAPSESFLTDITDDGETEYSIQDIAAWAYINPPEVKP